MWKIRRKKSARQTLHFQFQKPGKIQKIIYLLLLSINSLEFNQLEMWKVSRRKLAPTYEMFGKGDKRNLQ